MLPESTKCKKVIAWSGDFGRDQYVSWCLPAEDLSLDTIWAKYEDFCKSQTNEVRAIFDLPTSFRQGNCSVDEWYNVVQAQVYLAKFPQKLQVSYTEIYSGFSSKMKNMCPRQSMIVILIWRRFPVSKVRQLTKKMELSKSTACHIKQVASDPQAAQVNLMRHQRTDLPQSKCKQ